MKKKSSRVRFQRPETRRVGLLMSDAQIRSQVDKWSHDDHAKLLTLCKRYGIEHGPAMFYELALALARELYPEPDQRGRKRKWTDLNKGALVVEVERLVKPDDPSRGVAWAVKQLAKREPWKSFLEAKSSPGPDPAEALRQRYFGFRDNKWARVMRDAYKLHEHQGRVAEWERKVADFVKNPHPK